MGFKLLRDAGIKTAIITSENTPIVKKRADKLKVDYLSMGNWTKLDFVKSICKELKISLDEVAYIGDDINDLELIRQVGFGCCPCDAVLEIREAAKYITSAKGGEGVIREIVDLLINNKSI